MAEDTPGVVTMRATLHPAQVLKVVRRKFRKCQGFMLSEPQRRARARPDRQVWEVHGVRSAIRTPAAQRHSRRLRRPRRRAPRWSSRAVHLRDPDRGRACRRHTPRAHRHRAGPLPGPRWIATPPPPLGAPPATQPTDPVSVAPSSTAAMPVDSGDRARDRAAVKTAMAAALNFSQCQPDGAGRKDIAAVLCLRRRIMWGSVVGATAGRRTTRRHGWRTHRYPCGCNARWMQHRAAWALPVGVWVAVLIHRCHNLGHLENPQLRWCAYCTAHLRRRRPRLWAGAVRVVVQTRDMVFDCPTFSRRYWRVRCLVHRRLQRVSLGPNSEHEFYRLDSGGDGMVTRCDVAALRGAGLVVGLIRGGIRPTCQAGARLRPILLQRPLRVAAIGRRSTDQPARRADISSAQARGHSADVCRCLQDLRLEQFSG